MSGRTRPVALHLGHDAPSPIGPFHGKRSSHARHHPLVSSPCIWTSRFDPARSCRSSPGISARLPWWLVEGWPDYVGQSRGNDAIKFVVCQTPTPTLKQLEDGADPNGPPELGVQYYAFANSMVEYQYTTYGGKDGYRKLALAFKDDARPSVAFPKALGITPEQFYDDWKAGAKKKYCG